MADNKTYKYYYKKEISIPIIGIIIGEIILSFGIDYGFIIYLLDLLMVLYIIIFLRVDDRIKNLLQGLILLIILRIVNLSIPPFFTGAIGQSILIYGIIFVPFFSIIKNQQLLYKYLGIKIIYIPIGFLIMTLIFDKKFKGGEPFDVLYIMIAIFLILGTVEEIIFRSIIQNSMESILGSRQGIILTGILFGLTHANYIRMSEIFYASIFGIVIGYIFYRTRNIFAVISIHAITNSIIYGTMPIFSNIRRMPLDIILENGNILAYFLIILISLSFLVLGTKYWNKYSSNTLEACSNSLLLTFVVIEIYKIMSRI